MEKVLTKEILFLVKMSKNLHFQQWFTQRKGYILMHCL
jgi:hypothetical protein